MRVTTECAALAGLAVLLAGPSAMAQSPQGHGIAGFWSMQFGATPPRRAATPAESELLAHVEQGAVLLADAGATEFPPGDYGGLPVHGSLREAAKSYDPENQTDVSLTCRPPGLIYSMQGPFPIEIFEGREQWGVRLFDRAPQMHESDLIRVVAHLLVWHAQCRTETVDVVLARTHDHHTLVRVSGDYV